MQEAGDGPEDPGKQGGAVGASRRGPDCLGARSVPRGCTEVEVDSSSLPRRMSRPALPGGGRSLLQAPGSQRWARAGCSRAELGAEPRL